MGKFILSKQPPANEMEGEVGAQSSPAPRQPQLDTETRWLSVFQLSFSLSTEENNKKNDPKYTLRKFISMLQIDIV